MRKRREYLPNYLFVAPQVVFFILFLAWPILRGVQISLFDWKIMANVQRSIGLQNYIEVWRVLRNSFTFTGLVMTINTTLALFVAILLKQKFRGSSFLRAIFYLPGVLSVTVVGIVAYRVWDPQSGLLSYIWTGLLGQALVQWWTPNTEMMILVLTTVWWTFGFPMLIFLAGLHAIPNTIYEAAAMDGAGAWSAFRRITLPLLTPTLLFVLSTQFMTHMQMFGQAYQLSDEGQAQSIYVYLFTISWKFFRFGYAAAMGVVVTVIIMLITRLFFSVFSRRFEY